MSKFFYNRAKTKICAKKPFIVIECNCDCSGFGKFPINCVFYSPGWTNLKTTVKNGTFTFECRLWPIGDYFLFPVNVCLSAKICCSWSYDKFAKRATCEFFSALFLLLFGSGPKWSMPIEKLGRSSLVSSIFQREGNLHCSLTGRKLWSHVKKKCSRHLIYSRACVNKDLFIAAQ